FFLENRAVARAIEGADATDAAQVAGSNRSWDATRPWKQMATSPTRTMPPTAALPRPHARAFTDRLAVVIHSRPPETANTVGVTWGPRLVSTARWQNEPRDMSRARSGGRRKLTVCVRPG